MKHSCQTLSTTALAQLSCDCLIVGVQSKNRLSPGAKKINQLSGNTLSRLLKFGDFNANIGQTLLLYEIPGLRTKRLLLVGCGDQATLQVNQLQELIQAVVKTLLSLNVSKIACLLDHLKVAKQKPDWVYRHALLHFENTRYSLAATTKGHLKPSALKTCEWLFCDKIVVKQFSQATQQAVSIAQGIQLTKELGNLPGNLCTPASMAQRARQLAKNHQKLSVKVLNAAQLKQLGMEAHLAVGQGSQHSPKLIELHYRGTNTQASPIVLIGKGITFDSGGISLKPHKNMDEMKFDMLGAATVLGVIKAIALLKLPIYVIGLLATAENMPDGAAIKPGDVVKSLSGKTIEILNTDAEGRLVLSDALTYCKRFKPSTVIDVATLTGAAIVALGKDIGALMGNHDPLCHELDQASKEVGEAFWQLPLPESYQNRLQSNFADLANIGCNAGEAGSIIAGCFLSNFAEGFEWAHLDIAGISWLSGKSKGASGRPVATLTQYLINQC